jgi:hypothetical protein
MGGGGGIPSMGGVDGGGISGTARPGMGKRDLAGAYANALYAFRYRSDSDSALGARSCSASTAIATFCAIVSFAFFAAAEARGLA